MADISKAEFSQQPQQQELQWNHLDSLNLSDSRRLMIEQLKQKNWFKNTDTALQVEVATLPIDHDGFVSDLSQRGDNFTNLKVDRLVDLPRGNFALIPKFEVTNPEGKQYTYEYVSWKHGPESGAKGVVFVKGADGNFSHFIVLRGEKFATGKPSFDSVGGFKDITADGLVETIKKTAQREMAEELGVEDINAEIFDLGRVNPDPGMTNNNPAIFAAVIDASEAVKIKPDTVNLDLNELKTGAVIIPMSQLPETIMHNNDGLFQTAVCRAIASGLIEWNQIDLHPQPKLKPIERNQVLATAVA